MDKYETGIRIKEIRNLYKADDFTSAAQLAKDIDWPKVKSWDALAMMIDVYEQTGDNDSARDMAVLAYNRNLGGKKLVYRLTDILIKLGEMDDARELYKEYCSLARNSADRHILNYHILRAEKAPDSELITALENFRDGEVDERYMYRLAQLYAKNGNIDKCINTCDDIALWFKDGEYAQGAVKLKKRVGGALTPAQEELFAKAKVHEEELSKTQQITFADQLELNEERNEVEMEEDTNETVSKEAPKTQGVASSKAEESTGVFSSLLKKAFGTEEEPAGDVPTEETHDDKPEEKPEVKETPVNEKVTEEVKQEKDDSIENIIAGILNTDKNAEEVNAEEIKESAAEEKDEKEEIKEEVKEAAEDIPWNFNTDEELVEPEAKKEEEPVIPVEPEESDAVAKALQAKDSADVSDDAKQEKPENPEEKILRESLTVGVMEIMNEESALKGQGVIDEEEQIEGQLNMEDWLNEVREQKYGKQNTKEYSRRELERMLDEKDEKSKAYDKLMEEQKRLASKEGKPFDEEGAKQKVEQQMMCDAARTDLAIRTGKATAKLENENKFHHGQKSVEEKILKIMMDSVQEEVKKGNLKEAPEDRWKRFETAVAGAAVTPESAKIGTPEEFPAEVVSAASVLVNFLTGKYNPGDVKKTDDVSSLLVGGRIKVEEPEIEPSVPLETPEVQNAVVAEADAPEPVLKDVQENAQEETDIKEPEHAAAHEAESEKAVEDSREKDKGDVTDTEKPFEEEPDDESVHKRNKTQEIIPEEIQADMQEEESAVAERIVSADAAADAILQRITGKVPVITPEMEKELGIKPEEEKSEEKVSAPLEDVESSIENEVEKNIKDSEENFSDTAHIDKQTLREIIEATPEEEVKEEEIVKETTKVFGEDGTRNTEKLEEVLKTTSLSDGKRDKVLSLFEEYYDFPEINTKVEEIIAAFPKESARTDIGNIIITDNGDMDMTTLAKDIAKAFGMISTDKKYKLIKTNGNALNGGGIPKVTSKLKGSVLVIEEAALMSPDTTKELSEYLKSDVNGNCIIMEDTVEKMNEFVSINKDLSKAFNHRIDMRDYTAEELVDIAKELAGRRGYTIDEDGRLALFMIVKEINSGKEPLTLDELDDIIADAAKRAKKRMKKNKEFGEPTITNSDFR